VLNTLIGATVAIAIALLIQYVLTTKGISWM
jgi:hypothetical protein